MYVRGDRNTHSLNQDIPHWFGAYWAIRYRTVFRVKCKVIVHHFADTNTLDRCGDNPVLGALGSRHSLAKDQDSYPDTE